jgi:hypothetical protein
MKEEQAEFERLLRALRNNCPDVFDEMYFSRGGERSIRRSLRDKLGHEDFVLMKLGELANKHLTVFGAKLAFAFHYKILGRCLPVTGGAFVSVQNQLDALLDRMPDLGIRFDAPQALQQGTKSTSGQFEYRTTLATDFEGGAFQAIFHDNFVLTLMTISDLSLIDPARAAGWNAPGQLEVPKGTMDPWRYGSSLVARDSRAYA